MARYRFTGDTNEEFHALGPLAPGDEREGPDGLRHVRLDVYGDDGWTPTLRAGDPPEVLVPATDEGLVPPVVIEPTVADATRFVLAEATAPEIIAFLREHPEAGPEVREAELAGKNRKTVLDATATVVVDPNPTDPEE